MENNNVLEKTREDEQKKKVRDKNFKILTGCFFSLMAAFLLLILFSIFGAKSGLFDRMLESYERQIKNAQEAQQAPPNAAFANADAETESAEPAKEEPLPLVSGQ